MFSTESLGVQISIGTFFSLIFIEMSVFLKKNGLCGNGLAEVWKPEKFHRFIYEKKYFLKFPMFCLRKTGTVVFV